MALDRNALQSAWDAVQGHDMGDWKGLMEKAIDAYLSAATTSRRIVELTGPASELSLRIARLTDPDYRVVRAEERGIRHERAAALITGTDDPTHRHVKRGSEYVLLGIGKMQSESWIETKSGNEHPDDANPSVDMREVAIYRSVDDGSLWVRPREEFEDGRFEVLP